MTKIEKYLNKDSKNFTKKDIIRFAKENDIKALNFRYVASDGKLKTLNFVYNDFKYLDKKMSNRVDGLESAEIKTIEPEKGIVPSTVSAVLPDKINVEKSGKKLIVIDPGHGGKDPGGRCLFGAREKDLNLDVAKKLYELLSKNKNQSNRKADDEDHKN